MSASAFRRPGFWRQCWLLFHRWAGLIAAPFLLVTGLTGAVISWDHELDALLNPQLTRAVGEGRVIPPLELAGMIEARHPDVRVSFVPFHAQAGESQAFGVQPRLNPETGKLFRPGFNQVFVDPRRGEELGRREWGAVWPITRENLVSFLYKLHFSLHFPEMGGSDRWGVWLLGGIAMLWTLDCFVSLLLTFPAPRRTRAVETHSLNEAGRGGFWSRWSRSWKIRRGAGTYKLNHDIHRAFGLWTWVLLLVLAFTAFSLNLRREVFLPVLTRFSDVTPSPFDLRPRQPLHQPIVPALGFSEIVALAQKGAEERRWSEPVGSVFYAQHFGIYGVQFFSPEADHGVGGAGHRRLYLSAADGAVLGSKVPWEGSVADLFVQAQFPLHSGRVLGLPGRILISVMGLVVALLSATGIYLWFRKRASRLQPGGRGRQKGLGAAVPEAQAPS